MQRWKLGAPRRSIVCVCEFVTKSKKRRDAHRLLMLQSVESRVRVHTKKKSARAIWRTISLGRRRICVYSAGLGADG